MAVENPRMVLMYHPQVQQVWTGAEGRKALGGMPQDKMKLMDYLAYLVIMRGI